MGVLHLKWIEPRHIQHQIRRWDAAHGPEQGAAVRFPEHDTGSLAGAEISRCGIHHGVGQPAGAPDDGNGSVAQAVKLIETARFVLGGH